MGFGLWPRNPKKSIKKTSSQEINDKKRKIQHERKRKSENDITLTSLKNNPKNLLNMIHEKNNNQDLLKKNKEINLNIEKMTNL